MSITSVDLYECDRCGRGSKQDPGKQPVDWVTVYKVNPPKANPSEPGPEQWLLCFHCACDIVRELRRAPVKAEAVSS